MNLGMKLKCFGDYLFILQVILDASFLDLSHSKARVQ